jgi:hypothetical protein
LLFFSIFTPFLKELTRLINIALFCLTTISVIAQPAILDYGDLAIVAVNANNNGCNGTEGLDEISFVCFKDITNGTTIDMTDNGWERTNAGLWGNSEGAIRIQRSGSTIAAGTVVTIGNNNGVITGISPDAGWTYTNQNPGGVGWNSLNLNQNGDQIYMMQGGTWNAGTVSGHNAVYSSGKVLYGFSTNNTWSSFQNLSQHSGLYPGMGCFNMAPSATSDYNKYTGPTTPTTQRNWLNRIGSPANWTSYSTCALYYSSGPNYSSGVTFGITPGGFREGWWYGLTAAWMDCNNWEDLRIPDLNTEVTITPNDAMNGPFVQPWINTVGAVCKSLDIRNLAALLISNVGNLTIYENLKNNGTFSHTSSGAVSFVGPVNSVLSGSFAIQINHAVFNKSAGATIFADTLLIIKATSTFTNGVVSHSGDSFVRYNATATATGASNLSHIDGRVQKLGSANFTFPVGNDGIYQPLAISGLVSASSIFEARFFNQSGPGIYGTSWGTGIDHVATCSHWTLDRILGTNSARVNLSWGNDTDCSVDQLSDLVVARWNGTEWQNHGQLTTTGNTAAGSVSSFDLISNFSPFALASTSILNPLPVEWLSFDATAINNKEVLLEWRTATETNNDYFAIEHSYNGGDFIEIGRINGAGNTSNLSYYDWTHVNASSGNNYYRIRQVDFNGEFEYSSVKHVQLQGETQNIQAFVTQNKLQINLSIESSQCNVRIYDLTGRILVNEQFGNEMHHFVDLTNLSTGVYLVSVETPETTYSSRFVR